jgi:type IV secretory pathway VirB2 component (pilin)
MAMQCPECRDPLPRRFGLTIHALVLTCPRCHARIRATRESGQEIARVVMGPCVEVGVLVGVAMVAVTLITGSLWWTGGILLIAVMGSLLWSWRVALKLLHFETMRRAEQ